MSNELRAICYKPVRRHYKFHKGDTNQRRPQRWGRGAEITNKQLHYTLKSVSQTT